MRLSTSTAPTGPGRGLRASAPAVAPAWSPLDLSNRLLHLRADLGVTLTVGRLTAWADQSGNGNGVAVAGASSTRPIPATWAAGNGATAIYFDGNDLAQTAARVLPLTGGFTIFSVHSYFDTTGRCVVATAETGGLRLSQNVSAGGTIEDWKQAIVFSTDGPATTTPQNIVVVAQVGANPGTVMHLNGAIVATSNPNDSIVTPDGALYIGAAVSGQFFKGYLAELVIVSGRASSPDIALWNAYALTRYGV